VTHQRAQAGSQQKKRKASQKLNQAQHFIKEKYLQEVLVPRLTLEQNINKFITPKEMKATGED
jgi:hypothetical protein